MARIFALCAAVGWISLAGGCLANESNELPIPRVHFNNAGTSTVSPQFAALGGGIPAGVQATFIGDVVVVRGIHFRENMKVFFGLNIDLARRPDSLFTKPRHELPGEPFVYVDPVTGQETTLEVEGKLEFTHTQEVRLTIPAAMACSPALTNPVVRLFAEAGSSPPETGIFHIVGPRCIAITPNKGLDVGGFAVTVHGDFFSPFTQVAFRYTDPASGTTVTIGDTPDNDITELFIDRHTLIVPNLPGVVPNSTLGLADELEVDVLLFENIDAITGSLALEPGLDGAAPCDALRPENPDVPLQPGGVRNCALVEGFTFLPTGVTDFPTIAGITPENGTEIGGNTVVIHGDQFDAFTADVSDPENPGIGIECPPDSGQFIAPLEVILVDRQTLVIKMPPCSVDIPEAVDFCLRNKFSIDNAGAVPGVGPGGDCIVFEDVYTFIPIPPIAPPIVTAIFPATDEVPPRGCAHDFGLERLMVVGDWFDHETTLNGGFEFLLPGGEIVQSQRTIFHNRNLIEVFTKRLPSSVYPLTADLSASVRVRNVVGHADFPDIVVFKATPDAGAPPVLGSLCGDTGPLDGGNHVLVIGEKFDTSTQVLFGANEATEVQFVSATLLIATAPAGAGAVPLTTVDDGDVSAALTYTYVDNPPKACPAVALLSPDAGSATGGYSILAYGAALTPTTRVEFGAGDGNFSRDVFFVSENLLRIEVPEALPEQIGATVDVAATDPLGGCNDVLKAVPFTFTAAQQAAPEILFVDTTVEVPVTPTEFPALNIGGGDRMLVIGRHFDQMTLFDITKSPAGGAGGAKVEPCTGIEVLTANIAVMTSPASPDDAAGLADLKAHNPFGDSDGFTVEYVEPGPPAILDVRNLDDGTTSSPIDANDRLLVFGDNFFAPVTVKLTGCDLDDPNALISVTLASPDVTLVEDHLIGVNIPPDTFCEGPLAIEVTTPFGSAAFEDTAGDPAFELIGPQPPVVEGVFPNRFSSHGGDEAIFFGRFFTDTTEFSVRTDLMAPGEFNKVLAKRFVSETVAIVVMPALPGGMPPVGESGDVKAEETDAVLRTKIGGEPSTVTEDLFTVVDDDAPVLLGVFPDHGFIGGGEQVLLLGANFLSAIGESNVKDIRLVDPVLDDVGDYTEAAPADLPLTSDDKGKYVILNDHEILLITNGRAPIAPEDEVAPVDVVLDAGDSELKGGYNYVNTPAVRTPVLLGITPNETRLNGGTSHLISGGFLTEATRIKLIRPSDDVTVTIEKPDFAQVSDTFLVFTMPDLTASFAAGDVLDVVAEKDLNGDTLVSDTLNAAVNVTFAGPPIITPDVSPTTGSAFGGTVVEITGTLFTPQSQVLFGTLPARLVVFDSPTRILAVAPALPVDAPSPGVDLLNLDTEDGTVDIAVFNQGGWAVLDDAFEFVTDPPTVDDCAPTDVREGETIRVTLRGTNFLPNLEVDAAEGVVTNIAVLGFDRAQFDFEAPTRLPGTVGPLLIDLTVSTNHGTAIDKCTITVRLNPTIDSVTTDFPDNDQASPVTGVHEGELVKATVKGANFIKGGTLTVRTRTTVDPEVLVEVDVFTSGGQFMIEDDETIVFTPPNVFNNNVPTLLDGNPNVGPVQLKYESPLGGAATLEKAFFYTPILLDFDDNIYTLPTPDLTGTGDNIPLQPAVGDINADGVNDVAVYAAHPVEAYILLADTAGDQDLNGDGVTPDWVGTFTRHAIVNNTDGFHVTIDLGNFQTQARRLRLAQMDDDDELEILIPGSVNKADSGRILIVNTDDTGFDDQSFYDPGTKGGILTLTVGDYDGDGRDDFAFINTVIPLDDRRIGIVTSPVAAFTFVETLTPLTAASDKRVPGELVSGDWDGDGKPDLMYGHAAVHLTRSLKDRTDFKIIVVDVDPVTADVVSQKAITNFQGGRVQEIEVLDLDKDGKDDAVILTNEFSISDDLIGVGEEEGPGLAVVLDPNGLKADVFIRTGFAADHGAVADINGDGTPDVIVTRTEGEWTVYFGDGDGKLVPSNRSFQLLTGKDGLKIGTPGIDAGDLNGDGLAELFMVENGQAPPNLVLWNNASR